MKGSKMSIMIVIGIVLIFIFVLVTLAEPNPYKQPYSSSPKSTKSIKDFLARDAHFSFVSATSQSGESTKAFIYSTELSVSEAGEYIKDKRPPFDSSDMSSTDKIILTYDDEYAVVYSVDNEQGKKETYVQASTRQYAYRTYSRGLYNPYRTRVIGYPDYYTRTYYTNDSQRYGSYRSRSSTSSSSKSVRSGSTSSSSSSSRGGGTSFGK